MTIAEQRQQALSLANGNRLALATVKRELRSGALPLAVAMADPPDALLTHALIDVIRWSRRMRAPGAAAITAIGRQALRDNVNLMVPLGEASERSRIWVAKWGRYWVHAR